MNQPVAVVGAAESDLGKVATAKLSALQLNAQAARRAIADAGLQKSDIDAVFSTGTSYGVMPLVGLIEYLGLSPTHIDGTNAGGGAWEFMVGHAAAALNAGLCKVALLVYGAAPRNEGAIGTAQRFSLPGTPVAYDDPFGMPLPGRAALAASRHAYLYGTKPEQLAEVAVAVRKNAGFNPNALYRDPITVEDVVNGPLVADPLHRLDCCVISNGGGAVILTLADRAKDLRQPGITVLGAGEAVGAETMAGWPDWGRMVARESGQRAFAQAGITPSDVDLLQLYDAFTINVLLQLEALGFCGEGESGPFVEGGTLAYDGSLPTNTDGGGLSSNHPGMRGIFLLIEAVRQLRGEAGEVQVPNAEIALCNGTGGPFATSGTVILGRTR
jgi:acetyl-CoA acetyltransferase